MPCVFEQQPLRTIRLYGLLKQFTPEKNGLIKLAVNSPQEAIKALCVILPGFEQFLTNSKDKGLTYAVFSGKHNLTKDELSYNGSSDIRIAPVIIGSKRAGAFQTILGAVLVVVGAVVGYAFGWTGVGAAVGVGMMKVGAAMMLGGVVQMLSPQQGGTA